MGNLILAESLTRTALKPYYEGSKMIEIEMLTVMLKELGYLDDTEEDDEKKDRAKDKPSSKSEQKEDYIDK